MREIQSSEAKAKFAQFLDEVERGETIVITRHGRPIAHLVPAPASDGDRVRKALDGITALRQTVAPAPASAPIELVAPKREGIGY